MTERDITCCFTGHRPHKLPWGDNEDDQRCAALKQKLYDAVHAVYGSGIRRFICGMAVGCDTYFCEAVLALRGEKPDVTLVAAVPYERQSERWSEYQRRRYDRLIAECDACTVISREYTPDCMTRRNRYMVDASSVLIAAYDGRPGGTMNTMLYAMRKGLEIIEISV